MSSAREPREIYEETQREGRAAADTAAPGACGDCSRRRLRRCFRHRDVRSSGESVDGRASELVGADSLGVRIVMAWITGAVIVLGASNHAIVSTLELVFGMRYGADVDTSQLLANLGLGVGGNLIGGLLFVTFVRTVQASE